MCSEIRIYFEGDRLLKPGFDAFFGDLIKRARAQRCSFSLIASGSGATAVRDFGIALRYHRDAWNVLLIDSEGPASGAHWQALCASNPWIRSHSDSIFWMVEMMESWFHADRKALERFYAKGFKPAALRPNQKVEEISQRDLRDGLHAATKDTSKGSYFDHKPSHGAKLLELIDPNLVKQAAPNCRRIFEAILAKFEQGADRPSSQAV